MTVVTGVVTTAGAPRPDFGTDEYAIPRTVPAAVPSTKTHANVNQRDGSVGREDLRKTYGETHAVDGVDLEAVSQAKGMATDSAAITVVSRSTASSG